MTAPTHTVFTAVIVLMFGVKSPDTVLLLGLGSILPDIDHPQSLIGRIFFFISHPLNKRFGHRTLTHSILFWFPITIIGLAYFKPLFYISLGVYSHLYLDTWNKTGVPLFKPLSEKVFVMASKRYRVKVASKNEYIALGVFLIMCWGLYHVSLSGGLRGLVRGLIGDYNTVVSEYEKLGLRICDIEGRIRFKDGHIEERSWLIIGKNKGSTSLALYDGKKVIKIPEDGSFLKAKLRVEDDAGEWNSLRLEKPMKVSEGQVFFRVSKNWYEAGVGDIIAGNILYRGEVGLSSLE